MTVCIGALCQAGKAAIVASDRMVTSHYPPVEFEHTEPKIKQLYGSCVMMSSGFALRPGEIINKLQAVLLQSGSNKTVEFIANTTKDIYIRTRCATAEEYILKPRGYSLEYYVQNGARLLSASLYNSIDHELLTFNYGLELLIVGKDTGGTHIYTVSNPGISFCYDTLGFHAIGIGNLHALQVFIANRYSINQSIEECISIIYAAKKSSEVAPGVGRETDIWLILESGKIVILDETTLDELSNIFNKVRKPPTDIIKESGDLLKKFMEEKQKESDKKQKKE
jgi:hypothetical protein